MMRFFQNWGPEPKPKLKGDTRTFRVWLDPNQYQQDMTNSIQTGAEDPYETFNIIMRRKPKENNFKVRGSDAAQLRSWVFPSPGFSSSSPWGFISGFPYSNTSTKPGKKLI